MEQLSTENPRRNTKIGNIFLLSSFFGNKITSDTFEGLSVERSCLLVNAGRSLSPKSHVGGRDTDTPLLSPDRRVFLLIVLVVIDSCRDNLWECKQSLKVFAFLYSAATGWKVYLFLTVKELCTTCWGRNRARSPQIRTLQAKGQSLWPPCFQVEKMSFTLFQTTCSPLVKSTYWHPVALAKLHALACTGNFELAFSYYEESLNCLGKKIFYLASMLSF